MTTWIRNIPWPLIFAGIAAAGASVTSLCATLLTIFQGHQTETTWLLRIQHWASMAKYLGNSHVMARGGFKPRFAFKLPFTAPKTHGLPLPPPGGPPAVPPVLLLVFVAACLASCSATTSAALKQDGEQLKQCELGQLPATLEVAIAEATAVLMDPTATLNWSDQLNAVAAKLAPGQGTCVVQALVGLFKSKIPPTGQADPRMLEAIRRGTLYAGPFKTKP